MSIGTPWFYGSGGPGNQTREACMKSSVLTCLSSVSCPSILPSEGGNGETTVFLSSLQNCTYVMATDCRAMYSQLDVNDTGLVGVTCEQGKVECQNDVQEAGSTCVDMELRVQCEVTGKILPPSASTALVLYFLLQLSINKYMHEIIQYENYNVTYNQLKLVSSFIIHSKNTGVKRDPEGSIGVTVTSGSTMTRNLVIVPRNMTQS